MQKPVQRTFIVKRVLGEGKSRRGDPFLECDTDGGVMAFWGGQRNLANIRKVQATQRPFSISCGCIAPSEAYAKRHSFWVPEGPAIPDPVPVSEVGTSSVSPPPRGGAQGSKPFAPSTADLVVYKTRLVEILDELEGKRIRDESPVSRIRRLGRTRKIPRTMEPLMLVVAEVRNASVHDEEPPTENERLAAQHAWHAVLEWARGLG